MATISPSGAPLKNKGMSLYEAVARAVHEATVAFDMIHGPKDAVLQHWDQAPYDHAETLALVMAVVGGCNSPEMLHNNKAGTLLRDGWTYGEVRNDDLKQTPLLQPYSKLGKLHATRDLCRMSVAGCVAAALGLMTAEQLEHCMFGDEDEEEEISEGA